MNKHQKQDIKDKLKREIAIIIGSIFSIAIVMAAIYFIFQKKNTSDINTAIMDSSNLTRIFSHKTGPDTAKVKLVEFYDPECEACAAFFPYVKMIMKQYGDNIQLTTRYALYHGNSVLAAQATDAAGLQGKYWEFQETLFTKQTEWSHGQQAATPFFIKYAQELNLNIDKFKMDMGDPKRMDTINVDLEDGKNLGVNGTPTFFINGKKLTNFSPEGLQQMIENELR